MYAYKFSNLCGSVYRKGNVLFTPDGNSLLSPVGNRITVFDLINNTSFTLPFENRINIKHIALSPNGNLLISVDEDGRALLVNFHKGVVLSHFNFKNVVRCLRFSPDGHHFAVSYGEYVRVWRTPSAHKEFAPFVLLRTYGGHHGDVTHIDWSSDSKYFLTTSKDMTARLYSLHPTEGFLPFTFSGHKDVIIAAFFGKTDKIIYTICRDGSIFVWKWLTRSPVKQEKIESGDDEAGVSVSADDLPAGDASGSEGGEAFGENDFRLLSGRWKIVKKQGIARDGVKARSASYSRKSGILVAAFTSGVFSVFDVREDDVPMGESGKSNVVTLHTLSISTSSLSTCAISPSGEWLAFGAAKLGQLLVWEWQSETYVLKQQGHFHDMNSIAYSPDASILATGDDYGKLKLWNTASGFCYVTFNEHKAPVSDIVFSPLGHSVFSCSLDGTVRAFDLVRYRNFRTFAVSDRPSQLSCLAIDPSGEIVCAGSIDPFEVYVWSVQTGKLVDTLAAHEAPLSALAFSPSHTAKPMLASASWDGTVRLWDIFATGSAPEVLRHSTDVLAIAFRPDGKELAAATLDGNIHFWETSTSTYLGQIEGRNDIVGGRTPNDRRTAKNSTKSKFFTSLCYSADGRVILAGGRSKWVVMYEVSQRIRIKRYQLSRNRAIGGTVDFLDSRMLTEAGPLELIDDNDGDSDTEAEGRQGRIDKSLPGVQIGEMASKRSTSIEIRCKSIRFAPTGRSWAAATTEGLLIYSLDDRLVFDPFDLDLDTTPKNIRQTLANGHHLKALVMALRLNEEELIGEVYHAVPPHQIQLTAAHLPDHHLQRFMQFIGKILPESPHIEYHLLWLTHLFSHHGTSLKAMRPTLATAGSGSTSSLPSLLRLLYKGVNSHYSSLSKLCDENTYTLDYLTLLPSCLENKPFQDNPDGNAGVLVENEANRDGSDEEAADSTMPVGWYNPDEVDSDVDEGKERKPLNTVASKDITKRKCPF